jgi:choice-of-anchor A domain-containing protein
VSNPTFHQQNFAANVVVDFICDESVVYFEQGELTVGLASNVVYNFGPACATTSIQANSITGTLLAPFSTLHQTAGRILGNVYVNDITELLQVNIINCPSNPLSCACCPLCDAPPPLSGAKCGLKTKKL